MQKSFILCVLSFILIACSALPAASANAQEECIKMKDIKDTAILDYAKKHQWDADGDGKICGEELAKITQIEDYAFSKCDVFFSCECNSKLKSIDILAKFPNLNKIGEGAFAG